MQAGLINNLPAAVTSTGIQRGYSCRVFVLRKNSSLPKWCASSLSCLRILYLTVLGHEVSFLHLRCITFLDMLLCWGQCYLSRYLSRAFHFLRSCGLVGIYRGVVEIGDRAVLKHHGGGKNCICMANVIFKQVCVSMSVFGCISTMPQCHPALYHVATFMILYVCQWKKLDLPLVTTWDCLDLHF